MKRHAVTILMLPLLCIYSDSLAQWVQLAGSPVHVNCMAVTPNQLSTARLFATTSFGASLSTDDGATWVGAGLVGVTAAVAYSLNSRDSVTVFVGGGVAAFGGGVARSTDYGTTWTGTALHVSRFVAALAVASNGGTVSLFAGADPEGVFLTTNDGTAWTQTNTGLTNTSVQALAAYNGNLFAGTHDGGVFLSTNGGANWTAVNNGSMNQHIHAFAFVGTSVQVGTDEGVFNLSNGAHGLVSTSVHALAARSSNLFAGTDSGVFVSTDDGMSWAAVNAGLTDLSIGALCLSNGYVFAGTPGGVWRRPIAEMITSVREDGSLREMPQGYELGQNYPNPFNPSTRIGFQTPVDGFVTLRVFDLLGREVRTLVNESLSAGSYERTFDAAGFTSGVYFYRLSAGGFVDTKRLLLLR